MNKILVFLGSLLLTTSTSLVSADLNLELPDLNLPDLGGRSGITIDSLSERQAGIKILRQLRGSGDLIDDPELNAWIRSIGNRLTSNAPRSATPYYFVLSRDLSVNAFATLGGVIVVNAGLILQTSSDSELAAVMAHEVAHITQRHIPRMIKKAKGSKFSSGAALIAGILASTVDPEAGQAIINVSLATMAHKQLSFNREAEAEADRVGLRILARSGFNPLGMPAFLDKLEQFSDDKYADVTEFLQNHPLTVKRVSDTLYRAKRMGVYKGRIAQQYLYMKEKIRVLSGVNKSAPHILSNSIKKYSAAMQLMNKNENVLALNKIGINSQIIPESLLIGKLLNKQRRYRESLKILTPLLGVYLGNEAISMLVARAYAATGQSRKAWEVISEVNITEQTSLEFFEVKKQIARIVRRNAEIYLIAAEKNIRMGNYRLAETLLNQIIKLPTANTNHLLRAQKLLSKLKDE